ncbi:TPA: MarR family transcriptional regulator [Escherichia coli]|nr:MarR family transcriptional regulator [Escherichia coli]
MTIKRANGGKAVQAKVLDFLKKSPNKNISQISEHLGIEKRSIEIAIKHLIKGGFIEFKKNNFSRSIKKIKEMRNAK